jgi:hypothetical protein
MTGTIGLLFLCFALGYGFGSVLKMLRLGISAWLN